MTTKNSKFALIALILIVIIAAFFRLYNIKNTPPGLYPDEAMNGNNALESISTGNWKVFYPENNGREGLFMNIQALSITAFGNKPWALRIVSSFFGIFTVLGIFFLAKTLFGHKKEYATKIALLSAFLMATNFWHINFSRIGFRAIMAPFFLVWAIYFILKSFDEEKYKSTIIAGIFYGLGFYSYIAFRATPLIIATIFLYWLIKYPHSRLRILKKFVVLTLVSLIVFAPLGYHFIKHPADFFGRTSEISIFSQPSPSKVLSENIIKTLGMFNFVGDWNWRHNYSGAPELFFPAGIMFLTGALLGIYYFFKKFRHFGENQFPFLVIFSWFATAALPVVISGEGIPHALRSILMIPPVIILSGFGGISIFENIKSQISTNKLFKTLLYAFSVFLLILIAGYTYDQYFIKWALDPNTAGAFAKDYVEIGKQLNSLPQKTPKYVVVQANGTDVRGIPMPAQTVMFITDTFTPNKQKVKNIFYILPSQINQIPKGAFQVTIK